MKIRPAAAVVFVASLALYALSLRNGFAYDDHSIIRLDPRIQDASQTWRFLTETYWRDSDLGLYRPLASLSYALDWQIVGDNAAWFHAMNVLWNAAVCTLVFLLLARLVPVVPALAGALLFAVHPVHVEAIANVVGRAEAMAACFVLAAMVIWLRTPAGTRAPPARLAAVAVCYALALMSKESAIMLPALIALVDVARGALTPRTIVAWLREHTVAFVLLCAVAFLYLAVRVAVIGQVGPGHVDPALDIARSSGERIVTALQAWPIILRLFFYPRVLLSDYGPRIIMPLTAFNTLAVFGAVILAALIGGGIAAWLRGRNHLAFVLLFLPVALLPVSNLIVPIGVIVAERALYLPSFVLAAAVAFALAAMSARPPAARVALFVALAVAGVLFTARTLSRIPVWASTTTVFDALRRDRPDSFRAKWHEARTAVQRNQPQRALELYAEALNIWPYRNTVVVEAANYGARVGDIAFARRVADHGLARWPDDVNLLRLRAGIALDQQDTVLAARLVGQGLQAAPTDSVLRSMLRVLGPAHRP